MKIRFRYNDVEEAYKYLRNLTDLEPKVGLILGSGLGPISDAIEKTLSVPYGEIPHFKNSTGKVVQTLDFYLEELKLFTALLVKGHKGELVFGYLNGVPVVCQNGRVHPYEGYTMPECSFPVRVMKLLGIETLFVTNSNGALTSRMKLGDIMIIKDHISLPALSGDNPFRTYPFDERLGERFVALDKMYSESLIKLDKE